MKFAILVFLLILQAFCMAPILASMYRDCTKIYIRGLSGVFSFAAGAVYALVLTLFGVYSFWLLCIVFAVTSLVFAAISVKSGGFAGLKAVTASSFPWQICVIAAASLIWYAMFPTQYLDGGRDYGLYAINGVHIADTGSMRYHDDWLSENYDEVKDFVSDEYIAIFSNVYNGTDEGADVDPGNLDPQFLPAFPAVLAVGYDVAGLDGLFRVNAVISALCLVCIYGIAVTLFSRSVGIISALFLALCPAQVWGARITQSEQLAQFMFLFSVWMLVLGFRKNSRGSWIIGSAAVGIGCFVRMDNYFVVTALFALICYCALWCAPQCKNALSAFAVSAGISAISLWYGFAFHNHYFVSHWERKVLAQLVYMCAAAGIAAIILLIIRALALKKREIKNPIKQLVSSRKGIAVVGAVLVLASLWCIFVRPMYVQDAFAGNSLTEYSWYMGIWIIPLAILGICIWLYAKDDKKYKDVVEPAAFLFVAGMAATIVYTINPAISPDHFWASRRWVSVNYPFLFLYAAVAIVWLYKTPQFKIIGKIAACSAAVCTVGYMAWQCRLFAFKSMMSDADDSLNAIAEALPDDEPSFTSNGSIASVLKYVYKKPVYMFRGDYNNGLLNYHTEANSTIDVEALSEYIKKNGGISVVGKPQFYTMNLNYETSLVQSFEGVYPTEVKGEYPKELRGTYGDISVGRLTYDENISSNELKDALAMEKSCKLEGDIISIPKELTGFVLWGPYITLPEGKYKITFTFADENASGEGYADISGDFGTYTVASKAIEGSSVTMSFQLNETVNNLEFRLIKESDKNDWKVTSVLLETEE